MKNHHCNRLAEKSFPSVKFHPQRSAVVTPTETRYTSSMFSVQACTTPKPMLNDKEELLSFIKILILFLKKDHNESLMHCVNKTICDCVLSWKQWNASGSTIALFVMLRFTLQHEVRPLVGEAYWFRTQKYLNGYKRRRQHRWDVSTGNCPPKPATI